MQNPNLNRPPDHAVAAATHLDPYPYYAGLRQRAPLVFDDTRSLWVASSAQAVATILAHGSCHVRPATEPVPAAIVGSPAGEVFSHLVRMRDGPTHDLPKLALERALAQVDTAAIQSCAIRMANQQMPSHASSTELADSLNRATFSAPVMAVAQLMGFSESDLEQVAQWMADFVTCLSPLGTPEQLRGASVAASALLDRLDAMLQSAHATQGDDAAQLPHSTLVQTVQAQAIAVGWQARRALLCNLVGLLSQTYEATAGLIGNTLAALARDPKLQRDLLRQRGDTTQWQGAVRELVDEVCRWDAPIQNTRRFVAQDTTLLGVQLPAGSVILLLLGSANRDPALNPHADELMPHRAQRDYFSFGRGSHACPGRQLALTLAASTLAHWLEQWPAFPAHNTEAHSLTGLDQISWSYRASVNARLPVFFAKQTGA